MSEQGRGFGSRAGRRSQLVAAAATTCLAELEDAPVRPLLEAALAVERQRSVATAAAPRARLRRDRDRLARLQAALAGGTGGARDLESTRDAVVRSYLAEIAARLDVRAYGSLVWLARHTFNWMSHAAAGDGWRPLGLEDWLPARITVTGAVDEVLSLAGRGTLLLTPTHQSHNDLLLYAHVVDRIGLPPVAWAAGLNLFRSAPIDALYRVGAFAVDRGRPFRLYRSALVHYLAQLLAAGVHTVLYPGGGRSRSGAIESELRLGLLRAVQLAGRVGDGSRRPVFVVPVTASYQAVLEAPWLIDEHLASRGLDVPPRRGGPTARDLGRYYWRIVAGVEGAVVRFGAPLDAAGERVNADDAGATGEWESESDPAQDRPRTERLGRSVAASLRAGATVLPSQVVAAAFLRAATGGRDVFDAPPASAPSAVGIAALREACGRLLGKLVVEAERGGVHLSAPLLDGGADDWIETGIAWLGAVHGTRLLSVRGDRVETRDPALLSYYANRIAPEACA